MGYGEMRRCDGQRILHIPITRPCRYCQTGGLLLCVLRTGSDLVSYEVILNRLASNLKVFEL